MKNPFGVLLVIGFYSSFFIIPWLIRVISKFLETKKYRAKLAQITPQLKAISTEDLSSGLLSTKESYLALVGLLRQRYGISGEDEQVKHIRKYTEEEADYRRSIKRPSNRTHRRKHRRYRRYY